MTVEGLGPDKIYNSADKIFELSSHDPIGLMIYNNLDFMGIPFDVAIKRFRDSPRCVPFASLQEAADAFFDYLLHELGADPDSQRRYMAVVVGSIFKLIRSDFDKRLESLILESKAKPKGIDYPKLFKDCLEEWLEPLRTFKPAECFENISIEQFRAQHVDAWDQAIVAEFDHLPLADDHRELLRELASLIIHRNIISAWHTGVVFAGFAGNDLFPSLLSFEVDGIVGGALKKKPGRAVTIDRLAVTAQIVPFAQHEMADRFLYGIDPDFEAALPEFLERAIRTTGGAIIAETTNRKGRRKELSDKLELSISTAVNEFKRAAMSQLKDSFKKKIQDMVSFIDRPPVSGPCAMLVQDMF